MSHAPDAAGDSGGAPVPSPSHSVELLPHGWRFDAPEDQTLLLAALDHGLRLAHSCRNGTCRACIAKLVSGRIEYRIEWPGLSREEKAEGWILPCVACARADLVLDQPQAINLFDVPPPPARG
ncbi:2Fe-2S iron-sulfur cluster-binding protein [Mitsuaria sp. GD03876]|uniref:2Fe-2S iron-sulfur cluster-binding protein n=1 Tax=Mitsuaria sp. GD03876 TaxID=2975399 RepID=UPI002446D798|nr:2Fe-2S iron-sulfur cluster-binding protein [Mitsuaria sp. GD03876]MDH0866194.1 2Fe-2S iron-sulfur cluster-binding protein [Mitsuaria sp. GD03876]